jgi:hypothetical protein
VTGKHQGGSNAALDHCTCCARNFHCNHAYRLCSRERSSLRPRPSSRGLRGTKRRRSRQASALRLELRLGKRRSRTSLRLKDFTPSERVAIERAINKEIERQAGEGRGFFLICRQVAGPKRRALGPIASRTASCPGHRNSPRRHDGAAEETGGQ